LLHHLRESIDRNRNRNRDRNRNRNRCRNYGTSRLL
jgi:hypothetical protein